MLHAFHTYPRGGKFVAEPVGKDQVIPREALLSESLHIKEPNFQGNSRVWLFVRLQHCSKGVQCLLIQANRNLSHSTYRYRFNGPSCLQCLAIIDSGSAYCP